MDKLYTNGHVEWWESDYWTSPCREFFAIYAPYTENYLFEAKILDSNLYSSDSSHVAIIGYQDENNVYLWGPYHWTSFSWGNNKNRAEKVENDHGKGVYCETKTQFPMVFGIRRDGTITYIYRNRELKDTDTSSINWDKVGSTLKDWLSPYGIYAKFDWALMRKYTDPEPTVIIETTNQPLAKHVINVDTKVTYVTDLDGDGKNELIVGTYKIDGYDYVKLYRYKNGYQEVWSYAIPENGRWGGVTAITAGDVDNDGQKEIIVSTGQPSVTGGDRTLRIFKRKSGLDSWEVVYSYKLGERTEALAMAVGDADNDGKNELIVGMSWYARKILQFKYDGTKYVVSTVENTGSDVNSIDIADVDEDGKNEISRHFMLERL